MNYRLNTPHTAVVATDFYWIDAKENPPPRGAKLLCINYKQGIAVLSVWGEHYNFTHWAPLPKFKD